MAENKYEGYFCHAPFEFTVVDHNGNTFMCCPAWLTKVIGNLSTHSWEEVWNSREAVAVRESILDGSFRYCNESNCPHLRGQRGRLKRIDELENPEHRRIVDEHIVVMDKGPRDVTLQYDPTCNLTCPSCRTGMYKCGKEESEQIRTVHESVWTDVIRDATRITVAGNGDPFASKFYLSALRSFDPEKFPDVRIALISNCLLLTPKMWDSIANCHSAIESLHVSFNAATPETFRVNQRGGELDKLLANLAHLAEQRRLGILPRLTIGFYVRENNFREMPEIIRIAREHHVDQVLFGHIMPPPYMTEQSPEYKAMAVHLPGHPDNEALMRLLNDELFADPIVCLSNMSLYSPDYVSIKHPEEALLDQFSWNEFVQRLALDQEQVRGVKDILGQLQEEHLRFFSRPGLDDALSPIAYLVELVVHAPNPESDDHLQQFVRYSAEHIELESGQDYSTAFMEVEARYRRKIRVLLSIEQRRRLDEIPLRSLMSLAGYDAFVRALQRLLEQRRNGRARTPAQAAWAKTSAQLALEFPESDTVRTLINAFKREFAEACARVPSSGGAAPLRVLARLLAARDPKAQLKFLHYAAQQLDPETGAPYTETLRQLELSYRDRIQAIMPPSAQKRFEQVTSLMDLQTGRDPLGDAIRVEAAAPAELAGAAAG